MPLLGNVSPEVDRDQMEVDQGPKLTGPGKFDRAERNSLAGSGKPPAKAREVSSDSLSCYASELVFEPA